MSDYWETDMIFVHYGKRYGLTETCRTICMDDNDTSEVASGPCQSMPGNSQHCNKLPVIDNYQGKTLPVSVTANIKELINQGLSTRAIAKQAGVSHMAVYRIMQRPLIRCG